MLHGQKLQKLLKRSKINNVKNTSQMTEENFFNYRWICHGHRWVDMLSFKSMEIAYPYHGHSEKSTSGFIGECARRPPSTHRKKILRLLR